MADTQDRLIQLLKGDLALLQKLSETLDEEHQALADNDSERIRTLTDSKNDLLESIRERARRKVRLLVNLGYRPDQGAPSDFLVEQELDPTIQSLWGKAQSHLEHCQTRNEVNGRIIIHMNRRLGRMADILRGNDQRQSLYGSSGQRSSLNSSTTFASA